MHGMRERPKESPTALKAHTNEAFLNGATARFLRIQCEFEEPRVRLAAHGVENVVMIFGSARSKSPAEYRTALAELREKVKTDPAVQPQLTRLERMEFLCRYHLETIRLTRLITEFSMDRQETGLPAYFVGTGAGPGMMEAANQGAWQAGGHSVGFGISVPFETGLNPYVTPELGFEFHYFFTRKFWMAHKCVGLVVAPGGYGTCDELFELLTLMQTDKIKRRLPVILFGEEYWSQVLQFDVMMEYGLISPSTRDMVFMCDTADDAFEHLKQWWLSQESAGQVPDPPTEPLYTALEPAVKRQRLDGEREPPRPMPLKAYKNKDFINSQHSRIFRIQCEMEETRQRLEAEGISNTVMFVGSGRVSTYEHHLQAFAKAAKEGNQKDLALLARQQPLLKFHEVSRDLARRITSWSMERHKLGQASYHVATGGASGLVESANEGAWEAGGKSLAFSGGVLSHKDFNQYVTPELAFVFDYFFTRKFWMAYKCMGIVALPGGFGTCEELFEILTLMQCGKIRHKMPVVLVGRDYWQRALNWRKMADYGMISDFDVDQLFFTDSADEAFQHITRFWEGHEVDGQVVLPKPKRSCRRDLTPKRSGLKETPITPPKPKA